MKHYAATQSILLVSLCVAVSSLAAAADTKPAAAAAMQMQAPDQGLAKAVADSARTPKFVARDRFRHPAEELTFFGLKPNMTVIEVWPGSGYWTEILGPYLKSSGHYYAAVTVKGESKEEDTTTAAWRTRVEQQKDRYGTVTITGLGKGHYDVAPPGSADLIVTFRRGCCYMSRGWPGNSVLICLAVAPRRRNATGSFIGGYMHIAHTGKRRRWLCAGACSRATHCCLPS